MNEKIDRGQEAEDLVQEICHKMFLADFTVRNPKFLKGNAEKEAADFLVPFGETLLAFQVKSKTETKSALEKAEKDFQRIESKVKDGARQLNTIKTALMSGQLKVITNDAGVVLPFRGDAQTNLLGIVILELFGEDQFGEDERTAIYNGYTNDHGIPTHVFTRQVFETIASEIDTIPDFIAFLSARKFCYENGLLPPTTSELDFLALYKTEPDVIAKCITGECDLIAVSEDLWASYRKEHIETIKNRDIRNRPSLLIDRVVAWLHSSIGYDPGTGDPSGRSQSTVGTVEKYYAAAFELGAIPRLQRRMIGEKFLEKLQKADKTGDGHALVQIAPDTGVLVLGTKRPREERVRGLYNLASVAYCGLDLKKLMRLRPSH